MPGQPVFVTNCGYRQTTPGGSFSREYEDGRRPPPVNTPKLTAVLDYFQPQLVIVQLGTNWMDKLAETGKFDGRPYRKYIREFIRQLRRGPGPDPAIVWVMPPASSRYPAQVHEAVDSWIMEEAAALGFRTINSRSLTEPYIEGKTGGDGVHYQEVAGRRWAQRVFDVLGPAPERLPLAGPEAPR